MNVPVMKELPVGILSVSVTFAAIFPELATKMVYVTVEPTVALVRLELLVRTILGEGMLTVTEFEGITHVIVGPQATLWKVKEAFAVLMNCREVGIEATRAS